MYEIINTKKENIEKNIKRDNNSKEVEDQCEVEESEFEDDLFD